MPTNTWNTSNIPYQAGRNIIITGANSGIGFETARALAEKDANVTMACRNSERGKKARDEILQKYPQAKVELMVLDLCNLKSIARFAELYSSRYDSLDLLINNAGVMATPFEKTMDGFELQFGGNHLGHFALTAQLMPLLTQTPNARVVIISSLAHQMGTINFQNLNGESGYWRWPAYAQSKLANLLFAFELQQRLLASGHTTIVTTAHPGYTATNLQNTSLLARSGNGFLAQGAFHGALPTLRAATDPQANSGTYWGPGGFMELRGAPVEVQAMSKARDSQVAKRLWEVSESLTGISFTLH